MPNPLHVTHFSENIPVAMPSLLSQQKSHDSAAESIASFLASESLATAHNGKPHASEASAAPHLLNQKKFKIRTTQRQIGASCFNIEQWNLMHNGNALISVQDIQIFKITFLSKII